MNKLLGIRLLCLKTGCQEIVTEYDILTEDKHSVRISMADHTGEADERTIKRKWIGEITEYPLGDDGVEFKIMCLPEARTEAAESLRSAMMEYVGRLRATADALEKAAGEFMLGKG
ncbi:MAG TPA: hypothetical protein PLU72_15280 [Candidatus Ozemobacteraceae bacterium]|nr:hypothetical protein [Candidatus Ozemobacteraceae bacterium]HQG28252.1 hypothetical protein [Candidatus Ozemobacteraceae bacterium]